MVAVVAVVTLAASVLVRPEPDGSAIEFQWDSFGIGGAGALSNTYAVTMNLINVHRDIEIVSAEPYYASAGLELLDARVLLFRSPDGRGTGGHPGGVCAPSAENHYGFNVFNYDAEGYRAQADSSLFLVFYFGTSAEKPSWSARGVHVTYREGRRQFTQTAEGGEFDLRHDPRKICPPR